VSKLKYYVDKVKSFDLIGVDNGVFAISVLLLVFGLIVAVYLSAPVEKTTVEHLYLFNLSSHFFIAS
jgi:hypothetical protein